MLNQGLMAPIQQVRHGPSFWANIKDDSEWLGVCCRWSDVSGAMEKWSARRSLAVVGFLGAAAFTVLVRMLHSGSGRASWGTFAERVRAYNGVCGSLGADLAFSFAAFVAFAVCAGTETAITTLWPWKVREYAQREWDKAEQRVRELRESGGRFVTAKAGGWRYSLFI